MKSIVIVWKETAGENVGCNDPCGRCRTGLFSLQVGQDLMYEHSKGVPLYNVMPVIAWSDRSMHQDAETKTYRGVILSCLTRPWSSMLLSHRFDVGVYSEFGTFVDIINKWRAHVECHMVTVDFVLISSSSPFEFSPCEKSELST